MAIVNTRISDLVPNEKVLGNTVNLLLSQVNEIVTSGLAVGGPEVDAVAGGGPRKASIPFLNPLSTTEVNISTDNIADVGNVGKLEADEYNALRHDLNYGWGFGDLTRMVTLYDARGGVAAGIAQYWAGIYQKFAVSSMKGALGADAGLTVGDGTDPISVDMLIDAAATGEEFAGLFNILIVTPADKAKLQKLNAGNTFVPKSETNIGFDTFAGYRLIVSTAFANGTTVMARAGAMAFGEGTPAGMVPTEVERLANAGAGGGAEILHSRRSVVIHPQGFSYVGAVAADTTALETAANWDLAVPLKMVGFRKVLHTA